jgi:Integrase core domain
LQSASYSSVCCATASSRDSSCKPRSWCCGINSTFFGGVRHVDRIFRNPTAEWLARQITEAFPWDSAPKYLIRDNDRAFGVAFKARVRAMGIRDRPTSFRSPWQNGYVERLIGSIRRECTDHLLVFNVEHLRRILSEYATYYNEARTHVSLGKDAPCRRPIERFGDIVAYPILGGLHHRYARI